MEELVTYNGKYFPVDNFSGGEQSVVIASGNGDATVGGLDSASYLDNIILFPGGKGFRSRLSTDYNNATEFGAVDTYPVVGVGCLRLASGTEYILAIKKDKAYSATAAWSRAASYTDRTGAVSITGGSTAAVARSRIRWSFCTHNDLLIGFGGDWQGSPDAPFKWAGAANNLAALGGTPPSARICFSARNRVFAFNTAADPNIMYWSVLGNPEDWTGVGSGNAYIGGLDDGEPVLAAGPISNDIALVFKPNSIHAVDLTSAPFSSRLLIAGTGAHCFGSVVFGDGIAYYITPQLTMKSTDGNSVKSHPPLPAITGIGQAPGQTAILPSVFGFRMEHDITGTYGKRDIIVWCFTTGEAVGWDLINSCWLRFSTGYKFVSGAHTRGAWFYGGWTDQGRVFIPEALLAIYTDDTGEAAGNIACVWQSQWLNTSAIDQIVRPERFIVQGKLVVPVTYSATLTYGYDFSSSLSRTASLSLTGGAYGFAPRAFLTGRGNLFRFRYAFSPTTATSTIFTHRFLVGGKVAGQKAISA